MEFVDLSRFTVVSMDNSRSNIILAHQSIANKQIETMFQLANIVLDII